MTDRDVAAIELAATAARAIEAKQGTDIKVFDVAEVLAITEIFVVTSASNRRLVRAIVDDVEEVVRAEHGRSPLRVEGANEQQWVLVDYGDVIVHVFTDEMRAYYEIERLYRDVPTLAWQ
jgi:ribosome-associated protein